MFNVVLYEPEIPPNTGNIIRLCANTGATLHLVEPLGFTLDEPKLKRAFSTRGKTPYAATSFEAGDAFLFGPETRGLPQEILELFPDEQRLRLPMQPGSRSLNLSNTAAVVIYEAWRQLAFEGGS